MTGKVLFGIDMDVRGNSIDFVDGCEVDICGACDNVGVVQFWRSILTDLVTDRWLSILAVLDVLASLNAGVDGYDLVLDILVAKAGDAGVGVYDLVDPNAGEVGV
eukprot:553769_1